MSSAADVVHQTAKDIRTDALSNDGALLGYDWLEKMVSAEQAWIRKEALWQWVRLLRISV